MSTTIRDASLTTARRRQLALVGNRRGLAAYPDTVQKEQSISYGQTSTVPQGVILGEILVGQQVSGGCACTPAVTLAGFNRNSPAC